MVKAAASGEAYPWPVGSYVKGEGFDHIMMAMETTLDSNGVSWKMPEGTEAEVAELQASYGHLCKLARRSH